MVIPWKRIPIQKNKKEWLFEDGEHLFQKSVLREIRDVISCMQRLNACLKNTWYKGMNYEN